MNRRHALGTVAAGSAALGFPNPARAAGPLRIITSPIDPGAQPYYADDLGYFKAAGLFPEIIAMSNGAVVLNAIAANSAEIGFSNLTSLTVAFKRNIPITIIAPGTFYDTKTPTPLLLVAKNSPIERAADLNGKTIGAAGLGTIVEYAPKIWMDKNGGDASSVRFVEMGMAQMADALNAGRIDAGVVSEPYLVQARPQTKVVAQVYDAIAPRFTIAAFFANAEWARANADTVARFRSVISRTATWANSHHDESGAILAKYGKLTPEIARKMTRVGYEEKIDPKAMQPLIDLVARYGGIDASFSADRMVFKG